MAMSSSAKITITAIIIIIIVGELAYYTTQ